MRARSIWGFTHTLLNNEATKGRKSYGFGGARLVTLYSMHG